MIPRDDDTYSVFDLLQHVAGQEALSQNLAVGTYAEDFIKFLVFVYCEYLT